MDPFSIFAGVGALGGLLGSGDNTTTQQTQLPDYLQPYGNLYAQQGYNLSQQPYQAYPYETVAPFTQDQTTAMDQVRHRAMSGSPVVNAAQQQQLDTINGQYLNPDTNPYLQQTYDQAADRVTDSFARGTAAQTDARFARAGAFGGSAWNEMQGANQQALGDSLGGLAANIYGNNYANERSRQQQASQFSPNFAAQDYRDADALLNVGGMQQQQGQQYLTDDYSRFNQAQQYPYQQFQTFGQLFNPNLGSQTTATTPGVSAGAGLLGGAMGGTGIYNAASRAGLLGSATQGTPTAPYTNYSNLNWGGYAPSV